MKVTTCEFFAILVDTSQHTFVYLIQGFGQMEHAFSGNTAEQEPSHLDLFKTGKGYLNVDTEYGGKRE